jgi:hypothetical protein
MSDTYESRQVQHVRNARGVDTADSYAWFVIQLGVQGEHGGSVHTHTMNISNETFEKIAKVLTDAADIESTSKEGESCQSK